MRRTLVLLAFIAIVFFVLNTGWAFAGDGKAQGQPFQYLQQQIDELNVQKQGIQGAVNVFDDSGQFIGTLVGPPSRSQEGCTVFIPSVGKFAIMYPSGQINTSSLFYTSSNCEGTPVLENINHHWLVAIFNGVDYSFYTGGNYLGPLSAIVSTRRYNGSCENHSPLLLYNAFEAVAVPSSEVSLPLPFTPPYHYE